MPDVNGVRAAVGVAAMVVAAGCTASAPAPVTMAEVGRTVSTTPALTWHGGWRWHGRTVTVRLRVSRTVGAGTVTVDGARGRVVFGGGRVFVRAPAAYWTGTGADRASARRYANRWTDAGDPQQAEPRSESVPVAGQDLARFAPDSLGAALRARSGGECLRDWSDPHTPAPTWTPVPSGTAPPPGVPHDALRYTTPAGTHCAAGTYWVERAAPHRLVGYTGTAQPVDDRADQRSVTDTTLVVRPGSAADAQHVDAAAAAVVRGLPGTVPVVRTAGSWQVDTGSPDDAVCADPGCSRLDLTVHSRNTGTVLTVWMTVTITVYGDDRFAGRCHFPLSGLAPGQSAENRCTVTDPRLARITAAAGNPIWTSRYDLEVRRLTERVDTAQVLAELRGGS